MGIRVVVMGRPRKALHCHMHGPPISGLRKLHIPLGQTKKQGKDKSLSIQCLLLAPGSSGKSFVPHKPQPDYSEALEGQKATLPGHRWHLLLLLWTAPPSGVSQLCTMPRRRSGESAGRRKGREMWVRKLKGQYIAHYPHCDFYLHRFIIISNTLVGFYFLQPYITPQI